MKVLLVDDKFENLYLLETIFKSNEYTTVTAVNGAEALNAARADTPDLIIADILMPVMDGFNLCREIKKDKALCKVPFVFYTATYTDPKDEEFALSLGADKFVLKPQDPDDLLAIVEEVLRDVKNKNIKVKEPSPAPDLVVLKKYNETLVRKLEDKMQQLERSDKEIRENNILLRREIEERKQAEEETIHVMESLRESEERFRLLFENSLDAVLITSPDGAVVDANPSACSLFGWTNEEFKSLDRSRVVDENDPRLKPALEKRAKTGKFLGELTVLHRNGSKIPVELSSSLFKDRNGNIRASMVIRDITERKRTVQALTVSEMRYRRLFESAKDGIIILDAESGKIIDVNPYMIKMFKYSHERFLEKEIWEITFFKDIADSKEKFLDTLGKRSVRYQDLLLNTANDHKINVEFISNVYSVNNKKVIQCNIRDITERKKSEEALASEQNLLMALMDNIPDLIYFKDLNSRFLRINRSHADKLSLSSPESAIGKTDFDFYTEGHARQAYNDEQKIIQTGHPIVNLEEKETWPDGRETWVSTTKVPLRNLEGQIMGTFGISRDITQRKETEIALKENERKFRQFVETAVEGICSVDVDENITFLNQRMAEMLGYNPEYMIGRSIESFMFPEDLDEQHLMMERRFKGKGEIYERRFRRKDGTTMWTLTSASPIIDSSGKYIGSFGMLTDITDRKAADDILRESEEKFRSVTQSANDAIITTDSNGIIADWNQGACRIFGYSENEIIGQDLKIVIPQNYLDQYMSGIKRFDEGDFNVIGRTVELTGIRKNSREFPLELSLAQWETANGLYYTAIIRDITSRKLIEKEINLLAHSIESVTECVSITDTEDIIIFVNNSFCRMYQYDKDELIGKHISIIRPEKVLQEEVAAILPKTITGGWKGEVVNRKKDGTLFPILLSTSVVKDNLQNVIALIGVAIDITESIKARNELIQAKEEAEQGNRLKSEFLAQMSHEIRTPLNVVLGNVDYLNDSFNDNADTEIKECFDEIYLATKRIVRTIDLILNISDFQIGGYQPYMQQIDLNNDLLLKLYEEHQLSAGQKGLDFKYVCKEENPFIMADLYSLKQIFTNIIDNAIKFTKQGQVTISLEKNESDKYIVTVKDTGIGMSKEFLPQAFEMFAQEDKGFSRTYEGNGLGLALVKKYCFINNASINVDSIKNEGSTFKITFEK